MAPRSIVHRPADKMGQLLIHGQPVPTLPQPTAYQNFFQPADTTVYRAGRERPVIDGYYTEVKTLLEPEKPPQDASSLDKFMDKLDVTVRRTTASPYAGQQRELGSVRNLNETRRRTHGIVTGSSHVDMGKLLFPGCDEGEVVERPRQPGLEKLKAKVHGAKSYSDPTGGRALKAIRYESCEKDGMVQERKTRRFRVEGANRVDKKRKPRNVLVNQDLSDGYLKVQEALRYLRSVRSGLIRSYGAAVDICRKKAGREYGTLREAVDHLKSVASVAINFEKLEPLLRALNIVSTGHEDLQRLWDLFDRNIPLSEFKIGRLAKPFEDYAPPKDDDLSRPREDPVQKERFEQMQAHVRVQKFKDYDTAADLIAPKPGTPFGLSHVDYFMPRTKEEIKTIFRNFDLSEDGFEKSWKQARKFESCDMNKVSAENFKNILNERGVKLTSFA